MRENRTSSAGLWPAVLAFLAAIFLLAVLAAGGNGSSGNAQETGRLDMMQKYNMYMTNSVSEALDGIVSIEKVYFLSDEDVVAPMPNADLFGETQDPSSLGWLLEDAREILDGQETFFRTDMELLPNSKVKYYLDDTIFSVTWKMGVGLAAFTCAEVKVAHPSQFRRFMTGGQYGAQIRYTTTEMAKNVNAVTASNGDYYSYRPYGIVVVNGKVFRTGDEELDTCFVDDHGDLIFTPRGTFHSAEEVQQYVDEHHIRFSLSFGPVYIQDGQIVTPERYRVGEIDQHVSRAVLCQLGPCHYLVIAANIEKNYYSPPDIHTFARQLKELGIENAYALDGGQTATIVMGGERMNSVDYGGEREISDIIYFATALPNGG